MVSMVLSFQVFANTFPDRAVKVVVPTGPGGGLDIMARTIAKNLEELWKTPVVVENKPGGNAMIATNSVLESKSDGYTLLFYATTTYAGFQGMNKKETFDWQDHLSPLSVMHSPPFVLVVNSARNIKTLKELSEYGKARGLTYGNTAAGSPLHLYGAIAADKMNVKGILTPYKSVPQAIVDILNNNLDYVVLNWSNVIQHVQAGTMTPLFVFDDQRLQGFPNVPNLNSPGFTEYKKLIVSYNFLAKKDTPDSIRLKLQKDIDQAIKMSMNELLQKNLISNNYNSKVDMEEIRASSRLWKSVSEKLAGSE